MRVRTVASIVLLATACARATDITAPVAEQSRAVLALPTAPGFAIGVAPAGLAACWSGEGNASDIINANNGTISGSVSFAPGKFGQAFSFDALGGDVQIPASSTINVAAGDGFTFSAWIFPKGNVFGPTVGAGPILEFEHGAQLWQHLQFGDPTSGLFANLAESDLLFHIHQVGGVITPGQWNHAAVTYSKSTGTITIYANGVPSALTTAGTFTANTTSMLHLGARVAGSFGTDQFTFNGMIDEVQLYNRALSATEVASLGAATGTLCALPPTQLGIATQPAGAESGVAFVTQPVVEVRDASNAVVTGASNAVTVAIASGTGALSGTTTVNAVNGVATFAGLTIAGSGSHTLAFTSAGLTSVTSAPFNVAQVVRALVITTQPGGSASGAAIAPAVVVELRDGAGLKIGGATDAVAASVASGAGTLAGTMSVNAVGGEASFSNLILTGSGSYTLRFALGGGSPSVVSNAFNVTAPVTGGLYWEGFFAPVDNEPAVNKRDAGSTVPVTFGVGGYKGMNILAANYPGMQLASCTSWKAAGSWGQASIDDTPDTEGADHGDNGLKFDGGMYSFNWKTEKSWAGRCFLLYVKLSNGSMHTARFSFNK